MNYLQQKSEFTTVEEGIGKLKESVSLRDKMGGAMYWSILNEDCCTIANKVLKMGGDKEEIGKILGKENYR